MTGSRSLLLALGFVSLSACADISPTMRPDYVIHVTPFENGAVATPPPCPSWNDESANPFDNQPMPQFGCSTARNLASMAERPEDLVHGRGLGDTRGATLVGAIRRYDANQPRGLILPASETSQAATTTAPTTSSSISGDVTGGGSSPSAASAP